MPVQENACFPDKIKLLEAENLPPLLKRQSPLPGFQKGKRQATEAILWIKKKNLLTEMPQIKAAHTLPYLFHHTGYGYTPSCLLRDFLSCVS